jgi:hypothetical protein
MTYAKQKNETMVYYEQYTYTPYIVNNMICIFCVDYIHLNFRFKLDTHMLAYILYTRDLSHIFKIYFSICFVFLNRAHSRAKNSRPSGRSLFESKNWIKFMVIILRVSSRAQILP